MEAQQFLVLFVEVRILVSLHRGLGDAEPLLSRKLKHNTVIIVLMVSTSVCGAFSQGSSPVITQLRMFLDITTA